jgi:hypothetical protein
MGGVDRVRDWVDGFLDKHKNDPAGLTAMARLLQMIEDPGDRQPDLMLRAARAAFQAGGGRHVEAIEVYARAAYRVGHLDEAIRLQTLALEVAPEYRKASLLEALAYLKTCRKLRDAEF